MFYYCFIRLFSDVKQLSKGQKSNYDLLQLSHRLEKGLLIKNPKPLWGWEKAYRITYLLQGNKDNFSSITANAVLSNFLATKEKSIYKEDRIAWKEFINNTHFKPVNNYSAGGIIKVEKTEFNSEETQTIERLFSSRHSCREFSNKAISNEEIAKAVQMALRCPSACNRQPFRVYVIPPSMIEKLIGKNLQYKSDKILVITGDIRAFAASEFLDWFISPSIFAGYLTLSLHALGIGCCVLRKDLVRSTPYNLAIKKITRMSDSERIVLEMSIGYYNDRYYAPISNRAGVSDIVKFV